MSLIYKITNIINKKSYIGQTTYSIDKRWKEHIADSKKKNLNRPLYSAMRKYGVENFVIEVLEENIPLFLLDRKEIIYIQCFSTYKTGYNATVGGQGRRTTFNEKAMVQFFITNSNVSCAGAAKHFNVDFKTLKNVLIKYNCYERRLNKSYTDNLRKPVDQYTKTGEYITTFIDARSACLHVTGSTDGNSHINQCCRKKRKSVYGYIWKWSNTSIET